MREPLRLTAEKAVQHIQSNQHIYAHSVAQFPRTLVNALATRMRHESDALTGIAMHNLHVEGHNPFDDADLSSSASHHFFVGKGSRAAVNSGHGAYIPCHLSDIPSLFRRRAIALDWCLLNVSVPDRHGYCSLGTEVCVAKPAAESARGIIAQLNRRVPRTLGAACMHVSQFDIVVEVDDPLPETVAAEPSVEELAIGRIMAEMIPDGACLQVGIGAIPDAVLRALSSHRDLGVHSEMISDGVMELIQSGVVNNARKQFLPGRTLTSFLLGSGDLYRFVDDNPGIYLDDAVVTNTPANIAKNDNCVAINSAIEVDLTGQVCADSVGTYMVSGVGGQLDFETGSAMSTGGIPTICLRSTTKKTGKSTIVPRLREGAGVTTTRYHAHYIVTEFGAVDLWGKDLQERARLMISIAHPSARADLAREAFDRFKIVIPT